MKVKVIPIVIIFMLVVLSSLRAQWGASMDVQSGYASNIFSNYRQLADYYNNLQGYLNYDAIFKTNGLRLFYQGNATLFETYNYRNYQLHKAGLAFYNFLSEKGDKLSAGLDVQTRRHREEYRWYEYNQAYVYVNLKWRVQPQLFMYVGTNFRARDYKELTPYSYWQHWLYVRLNRSFNTGTSIIGELDVMRKQYLNSETSPLIEFPGLVTDGDGNNQQWVALVRVGQALSPKTGVSAQFLLRRNLQSSVRYLINNEGFYYSDDELFDDIFGYESEQVQVTLKQKLPWNVVASLGGTWYLKHYTNRLALDLQGYPFADGRLRDDERFVGWLSLTKTWRYSKSLHPVQFDVDVSLINNGSNDPYYTYNTHYISFGISQGF